MAHLYAEEGLTQDQIAAALSLPKHRVIKIIAQCFTRGDITISLLAKARPLAHLEARLCDRLDLADAIIVPIPQRSELLDSVIGRVLGEYLSGAMADGMAIGVGCGRTLAASLASINAPQNWHLKVYALHGGPASVTSESPFHISLRLGARLCAETYLVHAPLHAPTPHLCKILLRETINRHLWGGAVSLDLVVADVGDCSRSRSHDLLGDLGDAELASIVGAGAVGHVLGRFIDVEGVCIDHDINDRAIAMDVASVRAAGHIVLATGGTQDERAVRAAVKALSPAVLVTDQKMAGRLLGI
ncbi:sugar-binding transcriptional regulator [uncultured Aureimonas sp.]|uniref:sugar-binding transcriptional regulator n=1 Tax=uncultured Aureimonas sp. TaxID=1604662 RepID=UPI0025FFF9DB|nr:sugar-binding domain-containing protein [uncultured Aureimonas sp.]